MATETTKDAVVVLPEGDANSVTVTETGTGTTATFTAPTSNANVEVKGNLVVTGEKVSKSRFTFTESGKVNFTASTKDVKVKATAGNDSISFTGGSAKGANVNTGTGADSVTFGTTVKNTTVKLGKSDGQGDVVVIENRNQVKNLTIKNFGRNDTLIVGNNDYRGVEVEDVNLKGITVKFD